MVKEKNTKAQNPPRGNRRARDPLFIGALEKGVQVLQTFMDGDGTVSLSEVVSKTRFNKSAAQRLLHTWVQLGYLSKDPQTKRYSLTPKHLSLSYEFLRTHPLVGLATAHLVDARNRTKHNFNLCILDQNEIVYIVRVPGNHQTLKATLLGRRLLAIGTSGGRAILSKMPLPEVEAIINSSQIIPITPYTICDKDIIRREIEEAAANGYAICEQESLLGEIAVAVPVSDSHGRPVAAVNLQAKLVDWPRELVVKELAPLVMETAQAISAQQWGGRPGVDGR